MVLFLSLNLEVESQLSEFIFSSQSINIEPSSLSNPTWTHIAISMLRGEQVTQASFQTTSKPSPDSQWAARVLLPKVSKGSRLNLACAPLLTLYHLNQRMAFQCLKEFRAAVVFKCNNFKIQTLERTHTYTHIHSVPKINIIKVSAKLYSWEQGFWKLPDF